MTWGAMPGRRSGRFGRRGFAVALSAAVAVTLLVTLLGTGAPRPPAVDRLPDLAVTDPAFPATVGAHAGAPVIGGNGVRLLLNGDHIFPAKLAVIRSAAPISISARSR